MSGKKSHRHIRNTIIVASVLLVVIIFFGGVIGNNIKGEYIETKLKNCEMPEGVKFVDTISLIMNTSGTGNHCEIVYALVLQSELPPDTIINAFQHEGFPEFIYCSFPEGVYKQEKWFPETMIVDAVQKAFYTDDHGGDFVFLIGIDDAFSQMDIRGH